MGERCGNVLLMFLSKSLLPINWIYILMICDLDLMPNSKSIFYKCSVSFLTSQYCNNHFPDFTLTFFWLCHCQCIKRVGQIYLDLIFLLSLCSLVDRNFPQSGFTAQQPRITCSPNLLIPSQIWWENPDSRLSLGAVMMIYRDIISLSHQQENQVTTLNLLFYMFSVSLNFQLECLE